MTSVPAPVIVSVFPTMLPVAVLVGSMVNATGRLEVEVAVSVIGETP